MSMFIGAALFFELLLQYRVLWARGRVGSGKTLLCAAITDYLINKTGDFRAVVCNIPHRFPIPRDGTLFDTVCFLDEAHLFIDSRTFASNPKEYGGLARKVRSVWLFPSVYPIDSRLRALWVERTWRLGNWLWAYEGAVDLGYAQEMFRFKLWKPSKFFGLYDTAAIPFDDGGLSLLWTRTSDVLKERTKVRMAAIYAAMGLDVSEVELERHLN